MERKRNKASGFSLIELLIVVAIILIIVSVAIPAFSKAKIAADETAAASSLRAINSAASIYSASYSNGYPATFSGFGGTVSPATCDAPSVLANDWVTATTVTRSGYTFSYVPSTANPTAAAGCTAAGVTGFAAIAIPNNLGVTGKRAFCVSDDGTLHVDPTGAAFTSAMTAATCQAAASLD